MLIVSVGSMVAFMLVFVQGIRFALATRPTRQADNCEVAFLEFASLLQVSAFCWLWFAEPWKLTYNTPASTMFVGFTIFTAGYFARRIGALITGRERRKSERQVEDGHADRRVRRPLE